MGKIPVEQIIKADRNVYHDLCSRGKVSATLRQLSSTILRTIIGEEKAERYVYLEVDGNLKHHIVPC